MGLNFFACSGARAAELHETGQIGEESPNGIPGRDRNWTTFRLMRLLLTGWYW